MKWPLWGVMYQDEVVPFTIPGCGRSTTSEAEVRDGGICSKGARTPAVKTGDGKSGARGPIDKWVVVNGGSQHLDGTSAGSDVSSRGKLYDTAAFKEGAGWEICNARDISCKRGQIPCIKTTYCLVIPAAEKDTRTYFGGRVGGKSFRTSCGAGDGETRPTYLLF